MDGLTCPQCGKGLMRTRSSKRAGSFLERRRRCNAGCGFEDVALVKPAEVVSVRQLFSQLPVAREQVDTK